MKRIIALIISFVVIITGCSTKYSNEKGLPSNPVLDEFTGLDDENLLTYVEDFVYEQTIRNLDNEDYVVEEVRAVYVSQEYLEELAYNSQASLYFGYTINELDEFFEGNRYVFTLNEAGQTTVAELQEIVDRDGEEILKNVAIGAGVILVCVTVSVVSAGVGAPAAVTAVFTASAKTATTFAASSSVFGAASAGIVKGYETGDVKEAFKAAALAGSEGFKWGAISGAVVGGGKEAFLLKSGTKGGLTMSEVATIQKESQYPVELISKFNSMKQYEICKQAGLSSKMLNGKTALLRKIDLDFVDDLTGKTNLQLMLEGKAPIDPTGVKYELHHVGQRTSSPLAILQKSEHTQNGNHKIWHIITEGSENPAKQPGWKKIKSDFWKAYAQLAQAGGI